MNRPDNSLIGWAYYFVESRRWIPYGHAQVVNYLCGGNVSCNRTIFQQHSYADEITFHTGLRHAGKAQYYSPSILQWHICTGTLGRFLLHMTKGSFYGGETSCQTKAYSRFLMTPLVLLCPLLSHS